MGWIQWLDYDTIMGRLPPNTVLTIDVNVGDFVAEGEQLGSTDKHVGAEATAFPRVPQFVVTRGRRSRA
jgi:uncharacterized membrane protein